MRVLVLGSGGREHALCWAIGRSSLVSEVLCAPGSDGIGQDARVVPADLSDAAALVDLARDEQIDLVVVGPENPLAAGVSDRFEAAGIPVMGPSAAAAQLEGSKAFAKAFMARHGIPTAAYEVFDNVEAAIAYARAQGPLVVKADGLAAGKGVSVCDNALQAVAAIEECMQDRRFGEAGARVVLEERLLGEEVSYYVLSDGENFVTLGAAQDHKRALEGDQGENTGGMGAYSPTPVVDTEVERQILERVVKPTLSGMRADGHPFRGVLFVGLMITDGKPSVIEYNVRFGDPETQALLFGLESDLVPLFDAAAKGQLAQLGDTQVKRGSPTVCVVLASEGYPRSYATGHEIEGLEEFASDPDLKVFHAGTTFQDGRWRTKGGRVLGVTARGVDISEACRRAYAAVDRIHFKGAQHRRDIARRALEGPGKEEA